MKSPQWGRLRRRQHLLFAGASVLVLLLGVMYVIRMPGRSYTGPFPPLTAQEREVRQGLVNHVWTLAGEIGERNLWRYQALASAKTLARTVPYLASPMRIPVIR
jgi:hypothetical protein